MTLRLQTWQNIHCLKLLSTRNACLRLVKCCIFRRSTGILSSHCQLVSLLVFGGHSFVLCSGPVWLNFPWKIFPPYQTKPTLSTLLIIHEKNTNKIMNAKEVLTWKLKQQFDNEIYYLIQHPFNQCWSAITKYIL